MEQIKERLEDVKKLRDQAKALLDQQEDPEQSFLDRIKGFDTIYNNFVKGNSILFGEATKGAYTRAFKQIISDLS